jgi:adenosylmethionine---8-amino-7-oxononanoate aminotransferase
MPGNRRASRNFAVNSFDNLWFPFTASEDIATFAPLVIARGEGMYLFDCNGKRYMDAIGSWWVSVLGHNHPRITSAIKSQIDKLEHVLMSGSVADVTLKLTGLLASMVPEGLTRIFFSDDGSTSVEVALKMALQYWGNKGVDKTRFISLSTAYHGDTLGAVSVGNIPAFHGFFHSRFKEFDYAHSPYCYRCPCGKDQSNCSAQCMDSLEALLLEKADTVAGCIFEPMVQGASGMRVYPAKALKKIFDLCKSYNVLAIADEVATGFGRTGKLFACEHAGVTPDIMCVAKGLTGGYIPMAATIAKEEIYREFCGDVTSGRALMHGHTFTGNPLAAAAAFETLSILKEQNIPASLSQKINFFRTTLEKFRNLEIVGDVRSIGMIGAIELVKNRETKEKLPFEKRIAFHIAQEAIENGVLIRPLGDVIYFIPAYTISEKEIGTMVEVTIESIKKINSKL